ncbi:RNA binding protein [Iris pallida]|uniref:RNA binding protein n=1 Tax=Iris pallida TaxID=29817 RepID=A0AAX6EX99_IRIPA|nr:RNA binding protein [Iris pallida]KAJ6808675.1 RNA binding protein [Iris pallida]
MAKKRKLSKSASTPTSNSDLGSQNESEPGSQPEPMDEAPTVTPIQKQGGEEAPPTDATEPELESTEVPVEETTDPTPAPTNGSSAAADEEKEEEEEEKEEEKEKKEEGEEEEEDEDPSSIQKILELFPKDQLVDLLRSAASAHPDVLADVHRAADVDPAHRKVFVHGLGWDTNAETLTSFFRQYGEVEDCNAVIDKLTGKSKGYAFILFKHRKGARNALKEPQKKIGSRMTACQLASAGPVPPPAPPVSEYTQRKIYVSNVGADLDPQKLLQFFAKFGDIEEGPLGLDKATGKPKGFCLFVYKSVEGARKALEEPHKKFEGHMLHCQKAVDGPKGSKQFGFSGHGLRPKAAFPGGATSTGGHLMAPSGGGLGFNQAASVAAAVPTMNPGLGQALTALLANQAAPTAGLSNLSNLLGGLGSGGMVGNHQVTPMGNVAMQGGYGNQGYGGYGYPSQVQGGYGNTHVGQGRGHHAGGRPPYMGR